MKTLIACLTLGIISAVPMLIGAPVTEAQQAPPVPVIVTPTDAAYKVIDVSRLSVGSGQTPAATLENILNELAGQGWKVVTFNNSYLILSR
ncbi:MAG: hypothetical protein JWO08_3213 [Verrucomicrobiaceae bacterium]|nr:hypothetical protein [Verrucomicrobiaceae bacterium]